MFRLAITPWLNKILPTALSRIDNCNQISISITPDRNDYHGIRSNLGFFNISFLLLCLLHVSNLAWCFLTTKNLRREADLLRLLYGRSCYETYRAGTSRSPSTRTTPRRSHPGPWALASESCFSINSWPHSYSLYEGLKSIETESSLLGSSSSLEEGIRTVFPARTFLTEDAIICTQTPKH